jgi:hypothetical protein
VLAQGKLQEQGSHAELIQLDGQYAHLFSLQAQGYEADRAPPGDQRQSIDGERAGLPSELVLAGTVGHDS